MSDARDKEADPLPSDEARELRERRPFSMAEAIGREGGSLLKGESPVPRLLQVKAELARFIRAHVEDASGALHVTLTERVDADDVVCAQHLDAPLQALVRLVRPLLDQEAHLVDFVRRTDMRWGQMYDERPHFDRPGEVPHPDDEYTVDSVRAQLEALLDAAAA